MTVKKKTEVFIDGRNFTVVGSENDEYIKGLAKFVDLKIKDVSGKNDRLCQTMSAILAALNISDELYKANATLAELEDESKEPIEKYGDVRTELDEAKEKIQKLELSLIRYKDDLLKSKLDNEGVVKELKKQEQALGIKEKELVSGHKMIKSLQDKVFDNQIELIETKKELTEVVKSIDSEKNLYAKEEVKSL